MFRRGCLKYIPKKFILETLSRRKHETELNYLFVMNLSFL